eukprot:9303160-Lingulodinium_polyedra.AAC.1
MRRSRGGTQRAPGNAETHDGGPANAMRDVQTAGRARPRGRQLAQETQTNQKWKDNQPWLNIRSIHWRGIHASSIH